MNAVHAFVFNDLTVSRRNATRTAHSPAHKKVATACPSGSLSAADVCSRQAARSHLPGSSKTERADTFARETGQARSRELTHQL